MTIRTIRDMEFARPTEGNTGKKGLVEAHGIRVQVAERGREMLWFANDKAAQQQGSLAMPMESVPEIVQAQLDYVNYYNGQNKPHYFPSAGPQKEKKVFETLKFLTVHREERGEIVFALLAIGYSEEAIKNKIHQPEKTKELFSEALKEWFNANKAGEELRKKYQYKFNLLNVMTDLWPLPQTVEKRLRDSGVRIYSVGVQQWLTQSAWNIDDDLIGEEKQEVPDEAPVVKMKSVSDVPVGTIEEVTPEPVEDEQLEDPDIVAETTVPADPPEVLGEPTTLPPPPPIPTNE